MTHLDLWLILRDAKRRVMGKKTPESVRERSKETLQLCRKRLKIEGLTERELKKLAGF